MSKKDEVGELNEILHEGVRDGLFEVAEENDAPGETRYRLSEFGNVEAQRTIASKGLPFLVMVSSTKALADNTPRTVKSMSNEIVKDFPAKLKREAKTNFAPFWGEYGNWTPQQYLEAYNEAQS